MSKYPIFKLIGSLIESHRFGLEAEKRTQEEISSIFISEGVDHQREFRLSDKDIIDFMLPDGTGIEVKLKGSRMAIYNQVARYCKHDEVKKLILITNRAMGLPETINEKPTMVVNLSKGWL